jgi:hypothetical protein
VTKDISRPHLSEKYNVRFDTRVPPQIIGQIFDHCSKDCGVKNEENGLLITSERSYPNVWHQLGLT